MGEIEEAAEASFFIFLYFKVVLVKCDFKVFFYFISTQHLSPGLGWIFASKYFSKIRNYRYSYICEATEYKSVNRKETLRFKVRIGIGIEILIFRMGLFRLLRKEIEMYSYSMKSHYLLYLFFTEIIQTKSILKSGNEV
jgi:hypothetical protein